MSTIFDRDAGIPPARQWRRLVIIAAVIIASAGAWYLARPALLRVLARIHVGCQPRQALIIAALHELYPDLAPKGDYVVTYCAGNSGSVVWWRYESEVNPDAEPDPHWRSIRHFVTDQELRMHGSYRAQGFPEPSLGADRDGDGRIELTYRYTPRADSSYMGFWTWYGVHVILRIGADRNEIAAIVGTRHTLTGRGFYPHAHWQDKDGDGRHELTVAGVTGLGTPNPTMQTIAVLEWDDDTGVLRPRDVVDPNFVYIWTPPENRPFPIPADAIVERVFDELLPRAPTSAPATAPAPPPAPSTRSAPHSRPAT